MKNIIVFLMLVFVSSISFANQEMTFIPENGKVEFLAKGWPALLKINGKGEGVSGKITVKGNKASGTLSVKTASFKTGIGMRDDHMKNKYLHVEQYPTAELTFSEVELPKNLKGKFKFTGVLKLHDVEKPVSGKISLKGSKKGKTKLQAEFKIKISDFNIEIPSFKGVTVAEDVSIKVQTKILVSDIVAKAAK